MEPEILAFGIKDEFEGDSPLYFDLENEIETLVNYLKDNIDINEEKTFFLKKMTMSEFKALE